MDIFEVGLLIFAGLGAGFVNTLAGNGSLITLTILMEFVGLPALMANGTNRVGIFFHSIITSATMFRQHGIDRKYQRGILPILFIGGIIGGLISIKISAEQFTFIYRSLLIILFITLLVNPKKWLDPSLIKLKIDSRVRYIILFILGLYGGFIQMGYGIILLAVLVLLHKIPLIRANVIKLVSVFLYTPIVFGMFIWSGLVDWYYGLLLAVGQIIGGWITAKHISRWKHANTLAYTLLILMVCAALIKIYLI